MVQEVNPHTKGGNLPEVIISDNEDSYTSEVRYTISTYLFITYILVLDSSRILKALRDLRIEDNLTLT